MRRVTIFAIIISFAIIGILTAPAYGTEAQGVKDPQTAQVKQGVEEQIEEEAPTTVISSPEIPPRKQTIDIYVRPDVTIFYRGAEMAFYDVNKTRVFPILYNGTTYLPVRAASSLMERAVEWDNYSKSIFIGKTFQDPAGITKGSTSAAMALTEKIDMPQGSLRVKAQLRPDIRIFYEFQIEQLKDASGKSVYPILYQGSAYLPIRSISNLMQEEVEWDNIHKRVLIGENQEQEKTNPNKDVPSGITGSAIDQMTFTFNREKEIYNDVSEKIVEVVKVKDLNEKKAIAASISEDYRAITQISLSLKTLSKDGFKPEELEALENLTEFTLSMEMYVLVIENVAYMEVNNQDFSLLAETLLYYALDTQQKMEKVNL